VFEIPDVDPTEQLPSARYTRLPVISGMDVSRMPGVMIVQLPEATRLHTWTFDEPLDEGTGDFPPRLEESESRQRLITWLRIRQPEPPAAGAAAGQQDKGPTLLAWVGVNVARVVQSVPVFNEFIGLGNGEPDQMFALANVPVLPHTLRLVVEEPNVAGEPAWQTWRQVDDLLSAGADERVFSLDAESGLVRGGDGLRGMRFRGRILASYEYGGGPQGNLPIGAINGSPDPRLGGGYTLSNPLPTSGGALGETSLDGERRIPMVLRHRDRLVNVQDFRDITRRTPGVNVGRVEVLPLFRPANTTGRAPDANAPGVVTVLVIPRFPVEAGSGASDPLWPVPDRLFLSRVCAHLDERRLVTTEISVNGPEYQRVFVSVGIQVRAGFFVDKVEKDAEAALALYLSALPPGGPEGAGWPLKKRLVDKDLEAVVTRVPGVEYVNSIEMGVESPEPTEFKDLTGIQLPRLAGVSVRQGAAESLASVFAPPGSVPSRTQDVPIPVTRAKC
jgi:hypothetical protein